MNSKTIGYIFIGLFPVLMGTSFWLSLQYKKQIKTEKVKTPKSTPSWTTILKKRSTARVDRPLFPLAVFPNYQPFSEMIDGKRLWGYLIKNKGSSSVLIPPKFEEAEPFYQNISLDPVQDYKKLHAIVSLKGKKGLIDETGQFILKPEYDLMTRTVGNESNIIIRKGTAYKLLFIRRKHPNNWLFRQLSQRPYDKIEEYPIRQTILNVKRRNMRQPPTIYYWTRKDSKTGLLNQNRRILYTPRFERIFSFNTETGRAIAKKEGNYFVIDLLSRRPLLLPFDHIQPDHLSYSFFARRNGLYGLYTISGEVLAKPAFDDFGCFPTTKDPSPIKALQQPGRKLPLNKTFYTVRKGKLWGVLVNNGKLAMAPQYDKLDCFRRYQNFTLATKAGKTFRVCFDGSRPPKDNDKNARKFCQRRLFQWRRR